MRVREIVKIDEEKCNGCGLCIPACAEGAIQIIDGKARLIDERLCDGLGACIGECPEGALTIELREAEPFDESLVSAQGQSGTQHGQSLAAACPGVQETTSKSGLANWPIQIELVSPRAQSVRGSDLLLAADCVPFAYPDFHRSLLQGKVLLIGCPKLDDAEFYVDKLAAIFKENQPKTVTVVHMEVPCCSGLMTITQSAFEKSGISQEISEVVISVSGELLYTVTC